MNQDKHMQTARKSPPAWLKVLVVGLIGLGIFFRFTHLEQKPYWIDETYTSLAISGYTVAELQEELFNSHEIAVEALDKYQHVNPERGVKNTMRYLITSDPQLAPLYYAMVRLWAQVVGDSPAGVRSLSALLSLLLFPSIYWLCLELFEFPLVRWMALAIVAVSPLHLLYAQEARQYSLWTVMITVSSAALLRAMRRQGLADWGLYALTLSLGLYTHLFTALVASAHGIYVLVLEGFRPNKTLRNYLLSTIVGFFLFVPWLILLVTNINTAQQMLTWTSVRLATPFDLIAIWLSQATRIFVDINLAASDTNWNNFISESSLWYGISSMLCFLLLIFYFTYFIITKKSSNQISPFIFIALLGGVPGLSLMLPDLIFGGIRSITFRYQLPFYLSIQLAVAYVLAFHILSENPWQQKICKFLMVGLLVAGLVSDIMIFHSDTWWTKRPSVEQVQMAQLINQSDSPLLVARFNRKNLSTVLCFSHLLEAKVHLLLVQHEPVPMIPQGYSNIFTLDASYPWKHQIKEDKTYLLETVYPFGGKEQNLYQEYQLVKIVENSVSKF